MFGWKPRWLAVGNLAINLDHVSYFGENRRDAGTVEVEVVFSNPDLSCVLHGVTVGEIHYFLKHGKPRKRKAAK
jgi:hypothetical protein